MSKAADLLVKVLKDNLKVFYPNVKKTEASCRCPYCGDSRKSAKSAHFYIHLKEPFKFYCQRCQTRGIITPTVLKDLKVNDSQLSVEIHQVNKDMKYTVGRKSKSAIFASRDLIVPAYEGTKGELERLAYLNDRLGTDITLEEASSKFRIILNFRKFIETNDLDLNIDQDSQKQVELINKLNKNCIGFLNYEQSGIIFRSMDPDITGFRYHHYAVWDQEQSLRFYSLQSKIDILEPTLKVVITEGIIDIIGVYNHYYRGKDNENTLFLAVNGKGYNLVFNYLARLGFLDMDISIYSDSDVEIDFYKYLKSESALFRTDRWKVYYNRIGKDYGVPKGKIQLKHTII